MSNTNMVLGSWRRGEWPEYITVSHEGMREPGRRYVPERTCRNVCEWNIDTFHFTCSECGAEIGGDDLGDSPVFVGDYHEQLRYCPNCGARVVDE